MLMYHTTASLLLGELSYICPIAKTPTDVTFFPGRNKTSWEYEGYSVNIATHVLYLRDIFWALLEQGCLFLKGGHKGHYMSKN